MTTLRALLYADRCALINQLKAIRTSPARTIMWLIFALLVLGGIVYRIVRAAQHHPLGFNAFSPSSVSDALVAFMVLMIGVALMAGSRFAGLFANAAEARFIIGSPATPFVATIYIQARDIVVNGLGRGMGILWAALIYLPAGLAPGTFVRDLVVIVFAFALIGALPLARQLLTPIAAVAAQIAGGLVIVAGVAPLARDLAAALQPGPPLGPLLLALPPLHPGVLLRAGATAQWTVVAGLAVCLAIVFAFVARRASDAYPELYELSMNRLARAERVRSLITGTSASQTSLQRIDAGAKLRAPGGVAIFVWRAWTEYRRTSGPRATGFETAGLLIGGYALARIAAGSTAAFVALIVSISTILYILALMRAAALAAELRRPLFWLASATLFERLVALAVAHGWRTIAWFVLFAIGLAAGRAHPPVLVGTVLAGPAAVLLAISVSYAAYAIMPHDIDQRGPLMAVRVLAGYALAIPPAVAGIAVFAFTRGAVFAVAAAAATALVLALMLLGFASWRLDRMSIALG